MTRKYGAANFKVLRFTANGVTVDFDDYTKNVEDGGGWWAAVCEDCREKYASIFGSRIDRGAGSGTCCVKGCWKKADDYVDFGPNDVNEVADNAPKLLDDDNVNAALNNALWLKAIREQDAYRKTLLQKHPLEILEYAYEYAMREDIVCWLENNDLDTDDAAILLAQKNVLPGILACFENISSEHMSEIGSAIENHAFEIRENGECGTKDSEQVFQIAADTAQKILAEESEEELR